MHARPETSLTIRLIVEADRPEWVRMRDALWPGSLLDHENETLSYFENQQAAPIVFMAMAGSLAVGFLELDFRKYAPGCNSSPVPFIEGWYVDPAVQGQGIGRALMRAAEDLARSMGHNEIASDTEVDRRHSIDAHRALGYQEVERIVCFRKPLDRES